MSEAKNEPMILVAMVAGMLKLAPATVWRHVTGRFPNTYRPTRVVPLSGLCEAYDIERAAFLRLLSGRDQALTGAEAAARLGTCTSTLKRWGVPPLIRRGEGNGAVLRFSRIQIDALAASKTDGRAAA